MCSNFDKSTGRLNLAYQGLASFPESYLGEDKEEIIELDISNNRVLDFRFLTELSNLKTLILDKNSIQSHTKFPEVTNLTTFWVNHNKISNLAVFITNISKSFPNLKYLSMMNNDAAPSYFNGGTYIQYKDYRHYVISQLPELRVLDDTAVHPEERYEAERIYRQHLPTPEPIKRRRSSAKSRRLTKANLSQSTASSLTESNGGIPS